VPAVLVKSGPFERVPMTHSAGNPGGLTADGFARLLERLDSDPERAAHEYERLRRGLVKFFDWRGIWPPDECADEVLDRFARKVEGTDVQDVSKYIYGIARLVALERRRGPAFASIDDVPHAAATAPVVEEEPDSLQGCFDRCLAQLPAESRELLLQYYEGERSTKISNRRRLAALLGVTDNALRSRVQRLRERLEECVQGCSQPVGFAS
jgi:DNA-directed RNA polymerase specialized sigma24 family protein